MNYKTGRVWADINIPNLWSAVQRNLLILIGSMLAAGTLTYFSLSMMTPQYGAEARISLFQTAGKSSEAPQAQAAQEQLKIFHNNEFLNNIARTLNLHTHPEYVAYASDNSRLLSVVEQRTQLDYSADSGVLSIHYYSADPNLSSEAANAYANAFVVLLNEKNLKLQARLLQRSVAPLVAEYPRKGPLALFVMSFVGLVFLSLVAAREILRQHAAAKEQKLDDRHHQLDREVSTARAGSGKLKLKSESSSTPAFKGAYPWQPEEDLDEIVEQLMVMRKNGRPLRVLTIGEESLTEIASEASDIARAIAAQGVAVLLIDTDDAATGISSYFKIGEELGYGDVVRNPGLLGDVIQNDPESNVHIAGCGSEVIYKYDDAPKHNLLKIFEAWSAVYEVVIVCCSYEVAQSVHDILEDFIEVGVMVQPAHAGAELLSSEVSKKVGTLEVIYYRKGASDKPADTTSAVGLS